MRSIHHRPRHVETRCQVGHWEGDLIVGAGQRSAIATLVERRTRFTILVGLREDHSAGRVGDALIDIFSALGAPLRRTLTWDQGNELFHHPRIEQHTGLTIYFADPHSPWQRGSNESTNGLLRQYLPKNSNLDIWTRAQLAEIAAELNERPRQCLGDKAPYQLMKQWYRAHAAT